MQREEQVTILGEEQVTGRRRVIWRDGATPFRTQWRGGPLSSTPA